MITTILLAVLGAVIGVSAGYFYRKKQVEEKNKDLVLKSEQILSDAKNKSKEIIYDARTEALKLQDELKKDEQHQQARLSDIEERLIKKESVLDKKSDDVEKLRFDLDSKVTSVKQIREEVESIYKMQSQQLERIAAMSKEEAREVLLKKVEEEAKADIVIQINKAEKELEAKADERAKWIIADAISRCAAETTAESTATIVNLPNDEMKGRIIGREGRNIRALEAATGVELNIDDTPETVILSSFDPVRREIARISLERLMVDGRIHPARIEEIVEKVKKEVETTIREAGDRAVFELGLHGIHPELIKLIGRLKYRTSYAQNVLQHSIEVAYLAGIMAGELGVDVKLAKRAGILHDIGKAVDHEVEGSHQFIGTNLARKYGENIKVVNAIEVHHGEGDPITIEGSLVAAADALSAARPGARKEMLESYIKRLEKLEKIATSFNGVNKCYAIQAGREIRIIVKPEEVSDEISAQISRNLAKKIEEELTYPGQIKVTVIRESRYVEYAK